MVPRRRYLGRAAALRGLLTSPLAALTSSSPLLRSRPSQVRTGLVIRGATQITGIVVRCLVRSSFRQGLSGNKTSNRLIHKHPFFPRPCIVVALSGDAGSQVDAAQARARPQRAAQVRIHPGPYPSMRGIVLDAIATCEMRV